MQHKGKQKWQHEGEHKTLNFNDILNTKVEITGCSSGENQSTGKKWLALFIKQKGREDAMVFLPTNFND